jgi:hypothetical protein
MWQSFEEFTRTPAFWWLACAVLLLCLPTTVHYTLTESGREVLEICESTAYFAAVAKRKWPRANTPDPHLG